MTNEINNPELVKAAVNIAKNILDDGFPKVVAFQEPRKVDLDKLGQGLANLKNSKGVNYFPKITLDLYTTGAAEFLDDGKRIFFLAKSDPESDYFSSIQFDDTYLSDKYKTVRDKIFTTIKNSSTPQYQKSIKATNLNDLNAFEREFYDEFVRTSDIIDLRRSAFSDPSKPVLMEVGQAHSFKYCFLYSLLLRDKATNDLGITNYGTEFPYNETTEKECNEGVTFLTKEDGSFSALVSSARRVTIENTDPTINEPKQKIFLLDHSDERLKEADVITKNLDKRDEFKIKRVVTIDVGKGLFDDSGNAHLQLVEAPEIKEKFNAIPVNTGVDVAEEDPLLRGRIDYAMGNLPDEKYSWGKPIQMNGASQGAKSYLNNLTDEQISVLADRILSVYEKEKAKEKAITKPKKGPIKH